MNRRTLSIAVVGVLLVVAGATSLLRAQQAAPDVILTNGKIITVDERFTIAQAVAVQGDRIVAVGTNQDIGRLAGPNTRRIDLRGRSVTPGLIDNHMHLLRAGTTWQWEVRLDGDRVPQTRARDAARQGGRGRSRPMGLHPRRLGDGAVRRRQAAVHARRAGPGGPQQSVVPAGVLP